jgi:branched-chain amino acid transport system permease protein
MILAAAYGYANERIAYRRLRGAHLLAPLTSAIGVSIILQNFIMLTVSKDKVDFPRFYSDPLVLQKFSLGGASCSLLQVIILGTTTVMMLGLFWLINRTRLGIAMRAVAQDQRMAALVGIPVNRIIAFTFILGSALAAVAGMMVAMYDGILRFDLGYNMGLCAFAAAILGGIGNIPGAVLGGLILGVTEDLVCYQNADWKHSSIFVILMVVLLLRPRGLLGERVADKV